MGIRALGNSGVITETDLISKLIIKVEEEPNIVLANTEDTFALVSEPKNKESLLISLTDTTGSRFLKNTDFVLTKDGTTGISSVVLNTPVSESTEVIVKHFKEIGSDVVATTELSDFINQVPQNGEVPTWDNVLEKYVPKRISLKNTTGANIINPVVTDGLTNIDIGENYDSQTDKILLFKNNVPLAETTDYTVSGNIITLTTPLILTDNIYGFKLSNFDATGKDMNILSDVSPIVPSENDIMYRVNGIWTPVSLQSLMDTVNIYQNMSSMSDVSAIVPSENDIMYRVNGIWTPVSLQMLMDTVGVSLEPEWIVKTTNYTASVGDSIRTDTSGGPITILFPSTPVDGDSFRVQDYLGTITSTNLINVDGNGKEILNTLTALDIKFIDITFTFIASANKWTFV